MLLGTNRSKDEDEKVKIGKPENERERGTTWRKGGGKMEEKIKAKRKERKERKS